MSKTGKQLGIMAKTFMVMGIFMLFLGLGTIPLATSGVSVAPLLTVFGTAIPLLIVGVVFSRRAKLLKDDPSGEGPDDVIVSSTTVAASPRVAAGASGTNAPEGILIKAASAIPALADWMDHGAADEPEALLAMLDRTGARQWADAPVIHANKINRTGRIWLRTEDEDLPAATYAAMVGIEAALNVRADIRDQGLPATQEGIEDVLRATCDLPIEPSEATRKTYEACRPAQGTDSSVRLAFACAMEDLKVPFRLLFGFRESMGEHRLAAEVEIPTPASLALVSADPAVRVCAARAYALRLALLVARCAFASSKEFTQVIVNCHEHGSDDALLSLDLDPNRLDLLCQIARTTMVEGSAFPKDANVRASFGDDGWFVPVEKFVELADVDADPSHWDLVELSDAAATPALKAECGADRLCDLGILEEAARIRAWSQIEGRLGTSTGDAVALLSQVRDSAERIDVAEACNRVIQALAEGTIDIEDQAALHDLFVNGDALTLAVKAATPRISDDLSAEEALAIAAPIEAMLAEYDSTGIYLDDSESVYRFFGAVPERVAYNLANQGDTRRVRLVPDSYYHARRMLCTLLSGMGEDEARRALEHAKELQRIAPATVDADLAVVRAYEKLSHVYVAADQLVSSIEKSTTSKYLAICFYRLAFMEWHLDDPKLAAACYVHSLSFFVPEVMDSAYQELNDLCTEESIDNPSHAEAIETLQEAGIPLGDPTALRAQHFRAAMACVDAGAYSVSLPLFAEGFRFAAEDALTGVYRSVRNDD